MNSTVLASSGYRALTWVVDVAWFTTTVGHRGNQKQGACLQLGRSGLLRCPKIMKQVLDGKLYDTDEAELIARHNSTPDRADSPHVFEKLYRAPNGNYFLHGQGGPTTERVIFIDGETDGGEIRPLTREEALAWCEERHVDGEIIVEEFGDLLDSA